MTRGWCLLRRHHHARNAVMTELPDRMPVILEPSDLPIWLGEVGDDPVTLLRAVGDDLLRVWPVSRAVDSSRHNGVVLLDRIG
jgi:putative SOS response-associated peptidase YedK